MNFCRPSLSQEITVAYHAGRAIMGTYASPNDVGHKTDSSPLAEARSETNNAMA